jgi:hypothetical protein
VTRNGQERREEQFDHSRATVVTDESEDYWYNQNDEWRDNKLKKCQSDKKMSRRAGVECFDHDSTAETMRMIRQC